MIRRDLEQQGCWKGELKNRHKDGSIFWTRANIVTGHHPSIGRVWISVQEDISILRQTREELELAHRTIARFADHLQDQMEDQRREIAGEVHDQIGATLTGIRMQLESLRDGPGSEKLRPILEHIDQALANTRTLCSRLRPPMLDDLGLAETLRWYVHDWARQSRIRASTRIASLVAEPSDPLRVDLFRILQELLTNVARHAGARHIHVTLSHALVGLRLRVTDYGRGFPADQTDGFGLLGIRERLRRHGGQMHIESSAHGTRVTLTVPDARP